jgi:hypothetical protein
MNLMREWGANWYNSAPKDFVAQLANNFRTPEQDEMVLILKVLAADVNEGYHNLANWTVQSVNGTRVRNLPHLVNLIASSEGPYVEIENASGQRVVLDQARVEEQQTAILERYRIAEDRSPDLRATADSDPAPAVSDAIRAARGGEADPS